MSSEETKIEVDKEALRKVLTALLGSSHHAMELWACRSLSDSPIQKLVAEFNATILEAPEEKDGKG